MNMDDFELGLAAGDCAFVPDDFYESFEAPKYYDFNAPDDAPDVDNWFLHNQGPRLEHMAQLSQEMYKNQKDKTWTSSTNEISSISNASIHPTVGSTDFCKKPPKIPKQAASMQLMKVKNMFPVKKSGSISRSDDVSENENPNNGMRHVSRSMNAGANLRTVSETNGITENPMPKEMKRVDMVVRSPAKPRAQPTRLTKSASWTSSASKVLEEVKAQPVLESKVPAQVKSGNNACLKSHTVDCKAEPKAQGRPLAHQPEQNVNPDPANRVLVQHLESVLQHLALHDDASKEVPKARKPIRKINRVARSLSSVDPKVPDKLQPADTEANGTDDPKASTAESNQGKKRKSADSELCRKEPAQKTTSAGLSSPISSKIAMYGQARQAKKIRVTCPQPFRLRTEERGAVKEIEFQKKMEQYLAQKDGLYIPLQFSFAEAKVSSKDFTVRKEITKIQAGSDNCVQEKTIAYRAQKMPLFDRPFKPHRSTKKLTVPKEPNFHTRKSYVKQQQTEDTAVS